MRTFDTGATRDSDDGKLDYEGFLSPLVLQRYGEYMHRHRIQADGEMRDSDNWQKGIPKDAYMKSAWRHMLDWWMEHRGYPSREGLEDAICALIFNAMGYLHTCLSAPQEVSRVCSTCEHQAVPHLLTPCAHCLPDLRGDTDQSRPLWEAKR